MNFSEKFDSTMVSHSQTTTSAIPALALQSNGVLSGVLPSTNASTPNSSNGTVYVRKCLGKNKQAECLQGGDHANTRWECSYESTSKEEFIKHVKNIYKRVKWRNLVDEAKPDSHGFYRCVYFSTDKHHVENHHTKASSELQSPGSTPPTRTPRRYNQTFSSYDVQFGGKRKGFPEELEDSYDSQDAKKLLSYDDSQDYQREYHQFQDASKMKEIIDFVQKKLDLPQDMCENALEKLHQQACFNLAGLRTIKAENWVRLGLPVAIEDELKKIALVKPPFETNGTANSNGVLTRTDNSLVQTNSSRGLPSTIPQHEDPSELQTTQKTTTPATTTLVSPFTSAVAPMGTHSGVHYVGFHPWGQTPSYYTFSFPQHTPFPNDQLTYVQEEQENHPSTTAVQTQEIPQTESVSEEFRNHSLQKDRESKPNGTHSTDSKPKQMPS